MFDLNGVGASMGLLSWDCFALQFGITDWMERDNEIIVPLTIPLPLVIFLKNSCISLSCALWPPHPRNRGVGKELTRDAYSSLAGRINLSLWLRVSIACFCGWSLVSCLLEFAEIERSGKPLYQTHLFRCTQQYERLSKWGTKTGWQLNPVRSFLNSQWYHNAHMTPSCKLESNLNL